MIQNNHLSRELKLSSITPKKIFQKGEVFEFSNRRFLVVGSEADCPEIAQNLSPWFELIIVPIWLLCR
jgi:hypothetical protein